jgi:hypothetical protein
VATRAISYPFGAATAREHRMARDAGYEIGFTLDASWNGDAMVMPRLPVYMWSSSRPGSGPLASLERIAATAANRASVGTALWRRARGHAPPTAHVLL